MGGGKFSSFLLCKYVVFMLRANWYFMMPQRLAVRELGLQSYFALFKLMGMCSITS